MISDPLVWRHIWCPQRKKVIHQYKYALSDEATFERDEWGPWIQTEVRCNDTATGELITKTVFRSDPDGVELVSSYPDINDDPGMEAWLDLESWKANKVFYHLDRWKFHQNGDASRSSWRALNAWHESHQDSNLDIELGEPISLPSASLATSPMSWVKMWEIILKGVKCGDDSGLTKDKASLSPASGSVNAKSKDPRFLHPREKLDREALCKAKSVVELNRVRHPKYTEADQRVAVAKDACYGGEYLRDNINEPGALFLIQLTHHEGEFAVGLGRRTFNDKADLPKDSKYEIEWFERKNKKEHSWGKQPGFRLAICGYQNNQRGKPIYTKSIESMDDFLSIAVQVTKKSKKSSEPVLSQDTMQALRATVIQKKDHDDSEKDDDEDEDDEEGDEDDDDAAISKYDDSSVSSESRSFRRSSFHPSKRRSK